jgi:hypothetical protein
MLFNIDIDFTGLCGFIPRDVSTGDPLAYCVAMPNAWHTRNCNPLPKKSSIDRVSDLKPHRPFLVYPYERFPDDMTPPRLVTTYPLEKTRVRVIADPPPACRELNLDGFATFQEVATQTLMNSSRAVLHPSLCTVATQVILKSGDISSPVGNYQFGIENYLTHRPPVNKTINHAVTVSYTNLNSLTLEITNLFTGLPITKLVFTGADVPSPAVILVANLCLQDPLHWDISPPTLTDDSDFRWYYEMVDDPAAIARDLNGVPCPIPRYHPTGPNGRGFNCFPIQLPAVNFDPDRLP